MKNKNFESLAIVIMYGIGFIISRIEGSSFPVSALAGAATVYVGTVLINVEKQYDNRIQSQ